MPLSGAAALPRALVWQRGRLLPPARARISVFDHGLLYGDSIYETLRTEEGALAFLGEHLVRLRRSGALLGIPVPDLAERTVAGIVERARRRLRVDEVAVRITITRGAGAITPDPAAAGPPELLIYVRPYVPRPETHYRRGVTAVIAAARKASPRSLPCAAKTGNFLPHVLAMAEARRAGADEALMLSVEGHLAEGATSNLFWWRRGELCTPALATGILPGITRRIVMQLAARHGQRTRQVKERPRALLAAEEAFLTNSTGGVIPLVKVGAEPIGDGRVGPRTREMMARYAERLHRRS